MLPKSSYIDSLTILLISSASSSKRMA